METPMTGFQQFDGLWSENARLAWDVVNRAASGRIGQWMIHPMQHLEIETLAEGLRYYRQHGRTGA